MLIVMRIPQVQSFCIEESGDEWLWARAKKGRSNALVFAVQWIIG